DTVTTEQALKDIRQHFNYREDNYISNFDDAINDSESITEYIDYVSTEQYMKSHNKTKNDIRFEENYFNKQLEKMADIMLRDYDKEGQYADYTLMSDYAQQQDEYRNVAIETDSES